MSSIEFGDTMVPNIEQDSILLWGYSILHKEHALARFNHQKKRYSYAAEGWRCKFPESGFEFLLSVSRTPKACRIAFLAVF